MPFNGSGTYAAPALPGTWNPASSGSTIDPTDWNTLLADFVLAYSTAICKDGQTVITADIPMASHKFTGLTAGTGAGHSVRFEQVFPAGGSTLAALLRGYLSGVAISRASATTIGVAAGVAMDDTFVQMMPIGSVTINCATTGALGLDTGSLANNTWYHVYVIAKTDGTVSALASTSVSSPTYPTGYTLKRRIGSFRTNGSAQVVAFTQTGDRFLFDLSTRDQNVGLSAGPGTYTLNVPLGVAVTWLGSADIFTGTTAGTPSLTLYTPGAIPAATDINLELTVVAGNASGIAGQFQLLTNTSQQIAFRAAVASGTPTLSIHTQGWIDRRGRDD